MEVGGVGGIRVRSECKVAFGINYVRRIRNTFLTAFKKAQIDYFDYN